MKHIWIVNNHHGILVAAFPTKNWAEQCLNKLKKTDDNKFIKFNILEISLYDSLMEFNGEDDVSLTKKALDKLNQKELLQGHFLLHQNYSS